jgi:hypothetical protein
MSALIALAPETIFVEMTACQKCAPIETCSFSQNLRYCSEVCLESSSVWILRTFAWFEYRLGRCARPWVEGLGC